MTDDLTKILFQAKVNEVADLRKGEVARAERASTTTSESDKWWWIDDRRVVGCCFRARRSGRSHLLLRRMADLKWES